MRALKGLALGLAAAGLAGCGAGAGAVPGAVGSTGGSSHPSAARASATVPGVAVSTAPPAPAVNPRMQAGAREAAAHFYSLYSAGDFAALWNLLSAATKPQISRHVWVSVHDACPSAGAGNSRAIKAVTAFGNAAIVTETVTGMAPGTAEDVFSYVDGRWSYSPPDLSIYHHKSVTADIAAAKAAGFCASWKIF
jgi:hypothetical protein